MNNKTKIDLKYPNVPLNVQILIQKDRLETQEHFTIKYYNYGLRRYILKT